MSLMQALMHSLSTLNRREDTAGGSVLTADRAADLHPPQGTQSHSLHHSRCSMKSPPCAQERRNDSVQCYVGPYQGYYYLLNKHILLPIVLALNTSINMTKNFVAFFRKRNLTFKNIHL